ncbi:MAG: FtsW/RodA/SpoVE family cell cycle protein [Candidatus Pacebacteria bacterium]|nr:FtsW/RodA/SpoVE family cell cycle protein [Candidatus Paceibacterota bacterium]
MGIPLPFVSYSGSFTLAFYIGLGILMSLQRKG